MHSRGGIVAAKKFRPTTGTSGVKATPFTPQANTPVRGARRNWQSTPDGGRDVIPRRTINGAGRTNMFLQGGLEG
jgi:hypothetical protein